MKKVIWKYQLGLHRLHVMELPKDAEVLSVGVQNNNVYIWALVEPNADLEERSFEVYGTGHTIEDNCGIDRMHLGTVQIEDLVFHVFEVWEINNKI